MDFETRAIHDGQEPDPATGAITTPIYQTSTFVQEAVGVHKGYDYARVANPTRTALQVALASLENAEHGVAFSSGLGATTTLMHLVNPGERVVLIADVYGGVYRMTSQVYEPKGYLFDYLPAADFANLPEHLDANTRLVWIESPSNPLLNVVDIRAAAEAAHAVGAILVVDNTFATPYLQNPLDLGADVVLHSTTKYLGGHSDVVGGFCGTNDHTIAERLYFLQKSLGAVPGPFDSWLVLRGIKTLAVRMRQHCENARAIAGWLEQQPGVEQVLYPGLPSHPGHEIAKRQMRDFGGMISFLAESEETAVELVGRTKIFKLAESLGGVESLIEHPARMTHASTADAPFAAPRNLDPPLGRDRVGRRPDRRPGGRSRPRRRSRQVTDCYLAAAEQPIDLFHLGAARTVGAYLLDTSEGLSLFDCGPTSCLPALKAGLAERGHELGDVKQLLLSHIHLDHAGAAGVLVREHPELTVWVSEIGAPHLVDPSRLERSARRLYGDTFDELWGELAPVPEENVRIASNRAAGLEVFPAPGHASHHVCYFDGTTLYAGDAAGVRIQPSRSVLPPTPPPDVDIEGWYRTFEEIERRAPEQLALIHFGLANDVSRHLGELRERLDTWAGRVEAGATEEEFVAAGQGRPAAGGGRRVRPRDAVLAVLPGAEALLGDACGVARRRCASATSASSSSAARSPWSAARSRRSRSRSPSST